MMTAITSPAKMTLVVRKSRPHKRPRFKELLTRVGGGEGGEENPRTRNNFSLALHTEISARVVNSRDKI